MATSNFDFGTASAAFNLLAAFGALYLMQIVTPEAGIHSGLQVLMLGHRVVLAIVSIALFANAGDTIYSNTAPRPIDFFVEFVLLMVLTLSAVRHKFTPQLRRRETLFGP